MPKKWDINRKTAVFCDSIVCCLAGEPRWTLCVCLTHGYTAVAATDCCGCRPVGLLLLLAGLRQWAALV